MSLKSARPDRAALVGETVRIRVNIEDLDC